VLVNNGEVHCLDARTGTLLWERNLGHDFEIAEFTCRASPLIERNLLILFVGAKPGATVLALDKISGKVVWKALNESVSNSSPVVIRSGGQRQLIIWTCESVTSFEPATAQVLWRQPIQTSSQDAVATPVFENGHLLVSGLMFELNSEKPGARVLWMRTNATTEHILSHQRWVVTNATPLGDGASIHLTALTDGVLLFTDQGDLIRARLTPEGYCQLFRAHLLQPTTPFGGRKRVWPLPAFARRHVFARNDEELVCASLASSRKQVR
jgi:hypothetical protein